MFVPVDGRKRLTVQGSVEANQYYFFQVQLERNMHELLSQSGPGCRDSMPEYCRCKTPRVRSIPHPRSRRD